MLNATFVTRVFERGGAFSINRETRTVRRIRSVRRPASCPKVTSRATCCMTDKKHVIELATVDRDGSPCGGAALQVTLYKMQWRWWWDRTATRWRSTRRARARA